MKERRQEARFTVAIAVEVRGQTVGVRSGTMDNVSLGGAFIVSSAPPPIGAKLSVVVLDQTGTPFSLPATVRHAQPGGVGVSWDDLPADKQALLEKLLGGAEAE